MACWGFLLLFLSSCNTSPKQKKKIDSAQYKQPLINANKQLVEVESQNISNYISRHGWKMTETGSGLRYMIYQNGNGEKIENGNVVRYTVNVSLLTGKTCYTAMENGAIEFLVGQGGVASGLEEAVLHFRVGDKARIILPSHLAFGLLGDENCIPKKAVVIYDMEVLLVKK